MGFDHSAKTLQAVADRMDLDHHVVPVELSVSDPDDGMVMVMLTTSAGTRHIASAERLGLPHPATRDQILDALDDLGAED